MKFDSEIYLEATTDELFRRIHKRGRKEESDISFEYLDTLNEAYKKYAKKFSKWKFLLDKIYTRTKISKWKILLDKIFWVEISTWRNSPGRKFPNRKFPSQIFHY